ncbi:MAG TPA: hypothetical protein VEI02_10355, partial [Planctomycetota bacterium]|nr:hypothetical protein [Planctomycetota bacterium]
MNFRTWTALALCGAAVAAQAPASRPAAESRPAPIDVGDVVDGAVKVRDLDGAETTFADLRGKTVAIVFYSTQCPWMKAAEPKLKTLHAAWKSDKDVVFLAVDANRGEIGADPWANGAKPADPATTYADIRAH